MRSWETHGWDGRGCYACHVHKRDVQRALYCADRRVWDAAIQRDRAHLDWHSEQSRQAWRSFWRGFRNGMDPTKWPAMFRRWFRRTA